MERSASKGASPRNTSFRLKHFFLRELGDVVASGSWPGGCGIFVHFNAHIDHASKKPALARIKQPPADAGRIKDPEESTTGEEPMMGDQDSYFHTLAGGAGGSARLRP
jgi:hypothetical protein